MTTVVLLAHIEGLDWEEAWFGRICSLEMSLNVEGVIAQSKSLEVYQ